MSDLWTEATYDAEAETLAQRVTAAKVAAADLMPFLMAAETEIDFANRKAMVADRLDTVVSAVLADRSIVDVQADPSLFGVVRASLEGHLDEDFQTLAASRRDEAAKEALRVAEAARVEEDFRRRLEAHLAAKQASLQTQAEFPPKKDEQQPPATGTEVESKPEEQQPSGGVERKVELDPASGQYVGSEWEESEDGQTLVQSASTYGNNPRFATEEEANGWVAEGGKTEDTTQADEEPAEQPKSDDPFPEKEGKQTVPFGREAAADFEEWRRKFDVALEDEGVNPQDFPGDVAKDYFDGGMTPEVAANEAAGVGSMFGSIAPKQAAAGDTCQTCHGSGQVAAPEGSTNEGYETCPDCSGTGKRTASVKTAADNKANPAEGTVKDVGNGSLGERATCANCGKQITKGVAQRTSGWVHQSGSKWCPSGATAGLQTEASPEGWWPRTRPSDAFPGEMTLACPKCGGPVRMEGFYGPGGRLGDPGGGTRLVCTSCGFSQMFFEEPKAYPYTGSKTASWVEKARSVVQQHQHVDVGGGVLLDATTANMLITVYDSLSPENQAKFEAMDLLKAVDIGWKLVTPKGAAKTAAEVSLHWKQVIDAGITREDLIANVPAHEMNSALEYWDKSKNKTASAEGDAAPFVREAPEDLTSEAFTRRNDGYPQDPVPGGGKNPYEPSEGAVTVPLHNENTPGFGQGRPRDGGAYGEPDKGRKPKDTSPVQAMVADVVEAMVADAAMKKGAPFAGYEDFAACVAANQDKDDPEAYCGKIKHQVEDGKTSAKTAGDAAADSMAQVVERGAELAERHRQERADEVSSEESHRRYWAEHPDEYARFQQNNPYSAAKTAEANPYSTQGNPYIPPQTPPGTSDDVLDGPVNPVPQMLDVPMTTRPRQMPSGDSSLPDADLEDPAEPPKEIQ